MARLTCIALAIVLLIVGWLIFELTNVWPFNASLVSMMRAIFALGALGSLLTLLFTRSRAMPPLSLAGSYIVIGFLTNSSHLGPYIASSAILVTLLAILSTFARRPLYVR
ncbi:hypothetical protein ACQR50_07320 [Sphingomonas sp. Xoc002]|uniref:hypothetical protein n=1 Tax=Sphingomonas sp. Xoc002 TaxID=2837624 RepID=UPI003D17B957